MQNNRHLIDFIWVLLLIAIVSLLVCSSGGLAFAKGVRIPTVLMGFIKFAILATMGELMARRLIKREWVFFKIGLSQRVLVWGLLGVVFTFVFPLYSAGIDFLIRIGRLPVPQNMDFLAMVITAFWKSLWMNLLFAFPFMTFHRVTDILIDRKKLFSRWPFYEVWEDIDWRNMWGFVAPTIIWFWIPAHTITFCLPERFRILMAAGLSICLGGILAFAKKQAMKKNNNI